MSPAYQDEEMHVVAFIDLYCFQVCPVVHAFDSVIALRAVTLTTPSANNVLLSGLRQFASE